MANVRKMREADKQLILEFYGRITMAELAIKLGVSERTIYRWTESLDLDKSLKVQRKRRDNALKTMDCVVKKCCLVCGNYPACKNIKDKNVDSCSMLCWDFTLNARLIT